MAFGTGLAEFENTVCFHPFVGDFDWLTITIRPWDTTV